jgi:hypothetical protein
MTTMLKHLKRHWPLAQDTALSLKHLKRHWPL